MRLPFQFFLHFFFGHSSETADERVKFDLGKKVSLGFCSFPSNIELFPSLLKWKWILIDLFWSTDAKAEQWKQNKTLNNFIKIHKQFFWLLWFVVELNW